ncbi:transglutaminase-like domain-containing protein [uncultured Winogradskyella sp.]|uniref:transglutaminase-like domain-containing protein n=1 Tax=Winogradskyella sp. 4-2091 TaxID=3381659 RepID=UPI00260E1DC1|nr:transglutaminase-like domain-containing protein [uncultured Winogradskyella sp.]
MILKKMFWVLKRHPFLYTTRFKLLSKNVSVDDIGSCTYNDTNKKEDISNYYSEINNTIFKDFTPQTDVLRVQNLSVWLQNNIKGGPGLSEPSDKALKIMLAGKGGVCSDMAQVFNNFCVINEIRVREWGTTRAPFNTAFGGHSFNEFFSKELNKWILIDPSNSLFFYNSGEETPLSVVELFQLIRKEKDISYKSFNDKKKLEVKSIQRNYLNPNTIPFLICNYSNKTYDKFLRHTRPYIPVFVTHFALYLLRKSYHYRFPLDDYKIIFSED